MSRRIALAMAVVIGTGLWSSPAVWAQDPIHKMGRGVVNLLTSWIEIPKNMHLGLLEEQPLFGLGRGVIKGLGLTALRAGVGVYEAITFPIPAPRGYASPYEHMELADYAWE